MSELNLSKVDDLMIWGMAGEVTKCSFFIQFNLDKLTYIPAMPIFNSICNFCVMIDGILQKKTGVSILKTGCRLFN